MSTSSGDAKIVADVIADAKALVEQRSIEAEQLEMLDPVSPEDMLEARTQLGPAAGKLSVLAKARENKRGRPPGARNKRTDDFARYLLQFGQHPAITMMQIQSTAPELLIEASKQEKVHSFRKDGTANLVIERMTYSDAQALRVRCAEGLLPYLESKRPVAVDLTFAGLSDLIIAGETHGEAEVRDILEAEFGPVPDDQADDEDGGE